MLKLWLSFQMMGRRKLSAMIDRTMELALYAAGVVGRRPALQLDPRSQSQYRCLSLCSFAPELDVDNFNAALRQRLFDLGACGHRHTRVRGRQRLKLTCMNPAVSEAQMEALVCTIAEQAGNLKRNGP